MREPQRPKYDPVTIVAQLYDGIPWQGTTSKHSLELQMFWTNAWIFVSPDGSPSPDGMLWDGVMYHFYKADIDAIVSALTPDEVLAVLNVAKAEPSRILCFFVMARAIQLGWTEENGRSS